MPAGRISRFKPKSARGLNKKEKTQVKKMILRSSETKFHSETVSADSIGTVGNNYTLSDIGQGDTANTRDGNQILTTGLYQRYIISRTTIAGAADDTVLRVIAYIPRASVADTLTVATNAFVDMDKFTVLSDKLFLLTENSPLKQFTYKKSFKKGRSLGMVTQWSSGTSTAWTKNPIKLYVVSDNNLNKPTFSMTSKTFFKDK